MYTAAQESYSYYGDVRLVNGSNEREGRLEVCIGKVWGTVCEYVYYWSYGFLRVVCRQVGFEVDQGAGVFIVILYHTNVQFMLITIAN